MYTHFTIFLSIFFVCICPLPFPPSSPPYQLRTVEVSLTYTVTNVRDFPGTGKSLIFLTVYFDPLGLLMPDEYQINIFALRT
jgi:hypothetical protein